jgi:hypothetical protein
MNPEQYKMCTNNISLLKELLKYKAAEYLKILFKKKNKFAKKRVTHKYSTCCA